MNLYDDIDDFTSDLVFEGSLLDSHTESFRSKGSQKGKAANIDRGFQKGFDTIYADYFADRPVFTEQSFERRYRMPRSLFNKLMNDIVNHDSWFRQKKDAVGKLGAHPLLKLTAALRMLAYGVSADAISEYTRLSESTVMESMKRFCKSVIELYEHEYLRSPTASELKTIMETNARLDWPGMLASLDCMHYTWTMCPKAWRGQYVGKDKVPTIIPEAAVTPDLYCWHYNFGIAGSSNDLNVLSNSPLLYDILCGEFPQVEYKIFDVQ